MTTYPMFVDCETTGLDPDRHEVWEVALGMFASSDGTPYADCAGNPEMFVQTWFLPVDLTRADPIALDIGKFHERHPQGNNTPWPWSTEPPSMYYEGSKLVEPEFFAQEFARLTHGKHLAGAVPSFDEERLRKLLLSQNVRPSWHYHLIDVEAMAIGWKAGARSLAPPQKLPAGMSWEILPWKSEHLSMIVGVNPDDFDRHTAAGDVRWAGAMYLAMVG